jgi:hypothetical protein
MATFLGAIKSEKDEIISLRKRIDTLFKQYFAAERKYEKTESYLDEQKCDLIQSKLSKASARLEYLEKKYDL